MNRRAKIIKVAIATVIVGAGTLVAYTVWWMRSDDPRIVEVINEKTGGCRYRHVSMIESGERPLKPSDKWTLRGYYDAWLRKLSP